MRLFFAINFNEDTRKELLALRGALRSRSDRGNFTAAENMHLTLVFLGECNERQASAAIDAMESLDFQRFVLYFERVGRFKRSGGEIWWAGVRDCEPLQGLQRGLADKLAASGFKLERRGYSPHITLGREIVTDLAPWGIRPFSEIIHRIDLMKSERINGKLTYTAIHSRECIQDGIILNAP